MPKEGASLPITKILLQVLAAAGQAGVDYVSMFYHIKRYGYGYILGGPGYVAEMKKLSEAKRLKRALWELKKSKYIKAKLIGDRLVYHLTAKGVEKTLITKLRQSPKSKYGYTVVIFDVPESQNLVRRQLRWLLRQGGFKMLQQSVWITSANTYPLLKDFIIKMKLQSWVNVFYGNDFLQLPK
ncbi:MAG: CRISPR-associated endonuclease Cas2 [Candidatus Kerfeldbacteria bacterium]|nr:CRISPR-associated endonuclease Cas2 [Candidatus Kerfeldbacteria bacterium]